MAKVLFGTDGIRGKANEYPMTAEIAMRCGRSLARIIKKSGFNKKVAIGRDTRISGDMLEGAIASGLLAEGIDVELAGVVPTPAVAALTIVGEYGAGVMLTASHNPFEDNGIKIFGPDGYKLDDSAEEEMERLILSDETAQGEFCNVGILGGLEDGDEPHIGRLIDHLQEDSLAEMKVVVDCANGAASFVAKTIFESIGVEVDIVNADPDGVNINAGCGALHPETTAALVKERGAHIGVCFDGDADRVIFCDENGDLVSGDRVLFLCAKALKSAGKLKNDTLVVTVMSNLGLRDALATEGITMEVTGVGDRLVLERMREGGFSLGGENSGHIIFADQGTTGDGLASALQVLLFMKGTGKPLSELVSGMEEYPSILKNIPVKEKPAISDIPSLASTITEVENDLGEDGRVLVRYSGTEKKIRLLVEAKTTEAAESGIKKLSNAVESTIGA